MGQARNRRFRPAGPQGRRVDTKYPESIKHFKLPVTKILDYDYIWTEDYWFIFHNMIYKFHRKDLEAFVNTRIADWETRPNSNEKLLGFSGVKEMEKACPYEKASLPENTARLIEAGVMNRHDNNLIIHTVNDNTLDKWNKQIVIQNYLCAPGDVSVDGCYRYQRYMNAADEIQIDEGHYYKVPVEVADIHRKQTNTGFYVISRKAVENTRVVYSK